MSAVRTIAPLRSLVEWRSTPGLALGARVEDQLKHAAPVPRNDTQGLAALSGDLRRFAAAGWSSGTGNASSGILSLSWRNSFAARTPVHFDYRADNLFIDNGSPQAPIVVVDWQLAMWGLGAYDIARLAGGSILPAERGGHHDEIVNCWHQGLLAGGVTDYSIDAAWHDYRVCTIVAMLNPVLFHYMFKTGGPRGTALGEAMTNRFFCDLVECGAEAVVG